MEADKLILVVHPTTAIQLSAMPGMMLLLSMMLTTNSCQANKRILSYLILFASYFLGTKPANPVIDLCILNNVYHSIS